VDTRLYDGESLGTIYDTSWTTVGALSAYNVTGPGSYSVTATWGDNDVLSNTINPPVHLTDPDTNDGQVTTNTTVVLVVAGFFESASQVFGFDDFTTYPVSAPWKSLRLSASDVVDLVTTPSSGASRMYLVSGSTSLLTVSPTTAAGSPQSLTLTSISPPASNGETVGVGAHLGAPGGDQLALLHTAAYPLTTTTLKLAFRVVHLAGVSSTTQPYTAGALDSYLQDIFFPALAQFTSVTQLADAIIDYDLNHDGVLETSTTLGQERQVIINNCDNSNFDNVIFLVADGSISWIAGLAALGSRHGFIIVSKTSNATHTTAHELGHAAFSLKHTSAEAVDEYYDPDNLMWKYDVPSAVYLRKDQWHKIHNVSN
jgi:hypothetical protein